MVHNGEDVFTVHYLACEASPKNLQLLDQEYPDCPKLQRNAEICEETDKKIAKIGIVLKESFLIWLMLVWPLPIGLLVWSLRILEKSMRSNKLTKKIFSNWLLLRRNCIRKTGNQLTCNKEKNGSSIKNLD